MEEFENKEQRSVREEIFSKTVRAGKRTYFFDVKATRSNEKYLTITESKKRFNNEQGKFFYEKHKLFLYREDFEKFALGLNLAIEFIQTGVAPIDPDEGTKQESSPESINDIEFDKLGDASHPVDNLTDSTA
jgi:hypothetical protein